MRRSRSPARAKSPSRTTANSPLRAKSRTESPAPSAPVRYEKFDNALEWILQPHTIAALLGGLSVLIWLSLQESTDSAVNIRRGVGVAACSFVFLSALHMPDGLFIRPHPVFWRAFKGIGILYLMVLVFLLFQTVEDARNYVAFWFPDLGKPIPHKDYATDCRLYTPGHPNGSFANLKDALFDTFVYAHLIGWFVKALMLRDVWLCWILSISFEFLEYTFQHMLPNFGECWWDHWILDVAVCNALGIMGGGLVVRYLRGRQYNWTGLTRDRSGKTWRRLAMEFLIPLPSTVDPFEWEVFKSWTRFGEVMLLLFLFSVVELNTFFLKHVLWVVPPHELNWIRLTIWCFVGHAGIRDWYQFIIDSEKGRNTPLGMNAWLCGALTGVELLVCYKFWQTPPEGNNHPWMIFGAWGVAAALLLIVAYSMIEHHKRNRPRDSRD